MKKDKMLELSLYNYADINKMLITKIQKLEEGINSHDALVFLRSKKIDSLNKRLSLIWSIECEIEKIILENIHTSDEILILDKIKKMIQDKYPQLDMSDDVFKTFMKNRNYKGINDMRSFVAICEGDIDECKMYSVDSHIIIAYSILRTLIILNEYENVEEKTSKSAEITELTEKITQSLYDNALDINYDKIMTLTYRHKDFLLSDYKEYMKSKNSVFIEGVMKIIKSYFESNDLLNEYSKIEKEYISIISNVNTEENTIDVIELTSEEETEKIAKIKLDIDTEKDEDVYIEDTRTTSTAFEINECENVIEHDSNDLTQKCGNVDVSMTLTPEFIRNKAKEMLFIADELEKISFDNNEDKTNMLKEIEKENERLKIEIELLKKRVSDVSLKDFVKKIGGRECGYQLSELYMLCEGLLQDDGNIPGRLINLFGILESYSLEAYLNNKEINDEFEIDRKTLSQQYMLEMPLRGNAESVNVKLIKNGWKYNGEVIVSPLVRQI